jgi:AraC-like DNA-binding protein
MDPMELIPIVGVIQGLFLSLILLSLKSGLRTANRVLALLILSITITISNLVTADIHNIVVFSMLLFGPLFIIYFFLLTKPNYQIPTAAAVHFLPFIIVISLMVIHVATQSRVIPGWLIRSLYFMKNFHALGYSVAILIYMRRYRKSLKQRHSNIERLSLSWISIILALFILYFAIISPIVLILYVTGFDWIVDFESSWTPILISLYIFFLGFNGIRHHQVFAQPTQTEKNSRESFSEVQSDKLVQVMKVEKPYLSDGLTLDSLSEISRIPSHILSRIINKNFGMNFFDYVNSHRIAHFNLLYLDEGNTDRTILDLAMESGFYSKSTFNLSYKKHTGTTPTQFRKNVAQT